MYKKITNLTNENLNDLGSISNEIQFSDRDKRTGPSGLTNMSIYSYSKWKDWDRNQILKFKNCFDQELVEKSVIGWFLQIPSNEGFLDLMTTWVGKTCGIVTAYSLNDNQRIWLNGTEVIVNRGEGIKFSLSVPHEIKKSSQQQLWACLMTLN